MVIGSAKKGDSESEKGFPYNTTGLVDTVIDLEAMLSRRDGTVAVHSTKKVEIHGSGDV